MKDLEKVIKGLEHCSSDDGCKGCPYSKNESGHVCSVVCLRDAIALLKEQEPVKPIRLENWYKCPSCSGNIVSNMEYCPRCGRKVKWDEI